MDRRTRIYIFCVVVAFVAAVAVAAAVDGSPIRVFGWLPLLGLAVAAEALEIGAGEESGSLMSFSATAHVAAAILYGPAVAGILAALGVLIVDGSRLAK